MTLEAFKVSDASSLKCVALAFQAGTHGSLTTDSITKLPSFSFEPSVLMLLCTVPSQPKYWVP